MTITYCTHLKSYLERRYTKILVKTKLRVLKPKQSAQNIRTAYTTEKSVIHEAVHLSDYTIGNEVIQNFTYNFFIKELIQTFFG